MNRDKIHRDGPGAPSPMDGAARRGRFGRGRAHGVVLLPSKLRPPRSGVKLLDRPRLFDSGPNARIVVVRAPAGYGKTSLLAQWAAARSARGERTGCVTIDEDDDQAPRLLLHLAAALIGDGPARDGALGSLVADLQLASSDLPRILDSLPGLEGRFTLFLDEVEHLASESSIALLRRLVERLPEDATLVVASRTLPPIGLGRLRIGGLIRELGVDDLRFASDETHAFFASRGASLAVADVDGILARTEGWPAALELSALAIAGREDAAAFLRTLSGSHADVADYLAENVLDRQDEATRRFLLETSVLGRLSAPLCDAVTGRRSSRTLLERIASAGLFLTAVDAERTWYRFHPLFARFLQTQLGRRDPAAPGRLNRRAARWLARHGLVVEAVHHALVAEDFALAARLADRAAKEMNRQGMFATVVRWARKIPARHLDARPAVRAAAAWAHLFHRDFEAAERELERIERLRAGRRRLEARVEDAVRIVAPIMAGHRDRIGDTLALSREAVAGLRGADPFDAGAVRDSLAYGFVAAGRFEEARRVLEEARAAHARAGSLLGSVYTLALTGVIEAIEGRLGAAEAFYREAEALARRGGEGARSHLAAIVVGYFAELLYERDELDEAEKRLEHNLALAVESAVVDVVICAYLAAARVPWARGRREDAARVLREAERTGLRRDWPRLVAAARWEAVRFAVVAGDLGEARALRAKIPEDLLAAEEPPLHPHAGETEAQDVGELRLLVRGGDARRALPRIAAERRRAEGGRRAWRALRLRVLEAQALDLVGDEPAALRVLRIAVERAAPRDSSGRSSTRACPCSGSCGRSATRARPTRRALRSRGSRRSRGRRTARRKPGQTSHTRRGWSARRSLDASTRSSASSPRGSRTVRSPGVCSCRRTR